VMRNRAVGIAASLAWATVAVVAMTQGVEYHWPDYVHVSYGVPWTYAIHTLNTIAGPADKWAVDLSALTLDLVLWFVGTLMAFLAIEYLAGRVFGRTATGR
jgi:hypothetical protein